VIAGADAAIGALVTHERARFRMRDRRLGLREVGPDLVGAVVVGKGTVVGMHMRAGGDVFGRKADDLAEFDDRRALGDRRARDLVASRQRRAPGPSAPRPCRAG